MAFELPESLGTKPADVAGVHFHADAYPAPGSAGRLTPEANVSTGSHTLHHVELVDSHGASTPVKAVDHSHPARAANHTDAPTTVAPQKAVEGNTPAGSGHNAEASAHPDPSANAFDYFRTVATKDGHLQLSIDRTTQRVGAVVNLDTGTFTLMDPVNGKPEDVYLPEANGARAIVQIDSHTGRMQSVTVNTGRPDQKTFVPDPATGKLELGNPAGGLPFF